MLSGALKASLGFSSLRSLGLSGSLWNSPDGLTNSLDLSDTRLGSLDLSVTLCNSPNSLGFSGTIFASLELTGAR